MHDLRAPHIELFKKRQDFGLARRHMVGGGDNYNIYVAPTICGGS